MLAPRLGSLPPAGTSQAKELSMRDSIRNSEFGLRKTAVSGNRMCFTYVVGRLSECRYCPFQHCSLWPGHLDLFFPFLILPSIAQLLGHPSHFFIEALGDSSFFWLVGAGRGGWLQQQTPISPPAAWLGSAVPSVDKDSTQD